MDAIVNHNEEVQKEKLKNLKPAPGSDREKSPVSVTVENFEVRSPASETSLLVNSINKVVNIIWKPAPEPYRKINPARKAVENREEKSPVSETNETSEPVNRIKEVQMKKLKNFWNSLCGYLEELAKFFFIISLTLATAYPLHRIVFVLRILLVTAVIYSSIYGWKTEKIEKKEFYAILILILALALGVLHFDPYKV